MFLYAAILPDNKLINIALDDAYFLGVLSSRVHVVWALAAGSHLGVGNDPVYVKTACFEKFPFPAASDAQQTRIRALADIYNVLAKLRAGEPLTAKDKTVHEQGLVSVLRELHDELNVAVFDAYGWPPSLTDEEILARLVALNAERAAEEAQKSRPLAATRISGALRSRFTFHAARPDPRSLPRLRSLPRTGPLHPWPSRMAEQAQAVPRRARCAGRTRVRCSSCRRVRSRTAGSCCRAAGDAGHAGASASNADGGFVA